MASPFRIFRKHVKPLLAVFVVLLMLSWVVGDSLMGYLKSGPVDPTGRDPSQAPDAVAVKWDGGQLTNRELDSLVMRRRMVNNFIRSVVGLGEQRSLETGAEPLPLRVEPVVGPERPQEGVEQSVVTTKLVADLAREAGMKISDEAIANYLDELGRGRVTRADMRAIIQRMQSGGRASIAYIIDAVRDELLAHNYLASHSYALATVTPEERYADWLKSNDRIVLEVAPFPAEDFLVDVPEPTEAELLAFVQPPDNPNINYLARDPQPDFFGNMEFPSPHPGFATPRKIGVQYIEANYDKFLAKVEDEITEEGIAKYYEDNKDLFVKLDTRLIDESKDESKSDASEESTDESSGVQPSATDAGEPATSDSSEQTPPAEGQPSTSDTEQPPAEASDSDPESKSSSSNGRSKTSPFRLTAFLQEADAKESAETETAETASPADASTETPAVEDATASDSKRADASTPETAASPTDATSEPPAAEKPKEYQPLDEVRDEIRRQLAGERVGNQLAELMEKLFADVNAEFTNYFSASLNAQLDESGPPPPTGLLADLKSLAEQHGLEYGETGPMSYLELRKTPVGESIDPQARASLAGLLFASKDLSMYQPVLTVDLLGNRYLSIKTSDTPRHIPKLSEVRDEVAKAWKLRKAAELALKHAEGIAKKVEQAGSSLTNYFTDDKSTTVVRTDPFSWLTGGEVSRITGQQNPLRLSEPEGVVAAGPEFMSYVFELDDGEPGATLNHDKTIVYLVRIDEHQLTPDELRTAYLAEANTWPALATMISGRRQGAARLLLDDITSAANIEWERPRDQVEEEE